MRDGLSRNLTTQNLSGFTPPLLGRRNTLSDFPLTLLHLTLEFTPSSRLVLCGKSADAFHLCLHPVLKLNLRLGLLLSLALRLLVSSVLTPGDRSGRQPSRPGG